MLPLQSVKYSLCPIKNIRNTQKFAAAPLTWGFESQVRHPDVLPEGCNKKDSFSSSSLEMLQIPAGKGIVGKRTTIIQREAQVLRLLICSSEEQPDSCFCCFSPSHWAHVSSSNILKMALDKWNCVSCLGRNKSKCKPALTALRPEVRQEIQFLHD